MNRPKPKVGDTLFCVYHHRKHVETMRATVSHVGRKYFHCKVGAWMIQKFRLSDWCEVTDCSSAFVLYASEQEYLDQREYKRIMDEAVNAFGTWSKIALTLDQLRRIEAILKEETK